jgi:hypothetical protein
MWICNTSERDTCRISLSQTWFHTTKINCFQQVYPYHETSYSFHPFVILLPEISFTDRFWKRPCWCGGVHCPPKYYLFSLWGSDIESVLSLQLFWRKTWLYLIFEKHSVILPWFVIDMIDISPQPMSLCSNRVLDPIAAKKAYEKCDCSISTLEMIACPTQISNIFREIQNTRSE